MARNVEFALDHLLFLSGKVIEGYINELVFVICVVRRRICVKFVLLILSLDSLWKLGIKGVAKTANTFLIKILLIRVVQE
jgi:hypothetical protein